MNLRQYHIDAFATRPFTGNPAAVCPLNDWLDDALLQAIAEENNLSETAFFVPTAKGFRLRWFKPLREVDLCGHATLAAAHVLFEILGYAESVITFETRSGELCVRRKEGVLELDFPALDLISCPAPQALIDGLGQRPLEVLSATDYLAVFDSEETVRSLNPDSSLLKQLDLRGVIVTAPSNDVDFVSRFFAPKYGIPEDPVTGSAHCALAPYWSKRLNKTTFRARQVSKRGGELSCKLLDGRTLISGAAVTVMESTLYLPEQ